MIEWNTVIMRLAMFFLGVLLPMIAFQVAYADTVPCNFTADMSSAELKLIIDLSSQSYQSSTKKASLSNTRPCSDFSGGVYYLYNSDDRVYKMWLTTAGQNACAINPDGSAGNEYYIQTVYYQNGCILPDLIPAHCSDGSKNEDEIGLDCGGSCGPCEPQCASDEIMTTVCAGGSCVSECNKFEDPIAGVCPKGYEYLPALDGYEATCHKTRDADLVPAEIPEGANPEDYASVPVDDGWEASMSSGTESTSTSTTDNGDGTSTKTTITDKQNTINGRTDTSTITKNEIIDNSTGDVISTSTTIESQGPSEDNEDNFNIAPIPLPAETEFDTDIESPEKTDLFQLLRDGVGALPLMQALDGMNITTDQTVCTVFAGEWYGKEISFSLCRWEEMLRSLGAIAVVIAHLGAIFIVFRGVK